MLPPASSSPLSWVWSVAGRGLCLSLVALAAVYALYQKHCLMFSPALSRRVGRVLFWPSLPISFAVNMWKNRGALWTVVDLRLPREETEEEKEMEKEKVGKVGLPPHPILLGGYPWMWFFNHPQKLHALGVRAVINCLDETGPVHEEEFERLGIKQLWLPTLDHFEPSLASMQRAIEFFDAELPKGPVYCFCKAGRGRSAGLVMAYLMTKNSDASLKELNEYLLSRRRVRKKLYKQDGLNELFDILRSDSPKHGIN